MEENNKGGKMNFWLGFFAGLAVVSLIGFSIMLGMFLKGESTEAGTKVVPTVDNTQTGNEQQVVPVRAIGEDEYVLGDRKAKVQIIVYDDFECPYCLRHNDTMKQIRSTYGDKVAITYRHFPLSFHENAQKAAEAAECAGEQGKFFEMIEKLFVANENGTMGVAQFKSDAVTLKLNASKFNECLDSGKYAQLINAQMEEGFTFGVSGTPGTFVNGQLVSGAVPFAQFQAAIDSILAQ